KRSVLLHLFAIAVVLTTFFPTAQPAHAAGCVTLEGTTICPDDPPPDLLYDLGVLNTATPNQAKNLPEAFKDLESGGISGAPPETSTRLKNPEDQAVKDIIAAHGLPPDDADAVKSWARADAQAELFALLVKAINTPAASRTNDQKNAVAWITAVAQIQNVAAAVAAGREYVKWAGLSQKGFETLLATNPSESQLKDFLDDTPLNYADPGLANGGWCVYRSPAPYSSEYTGYTDLTCTNPCPFICFPPTPSYDQSGKGGQAQSLYPLLNSPSHGSAAQQLALGLEIGLPLAAAATAGVPLVSAVLAPSSAADLYETSTLAEFTAGVTAFGVVAGVIAVAVVLAALTTAIITGINVTNAADLPGKLAKLISDARTTPPDPATLLSSSSGGTSLFSLFVGATVPTPEKRSCDNSATRPEFTNLGSASVIFFQSTVPCLNLTVIPAPSATDPQFLVKAKDATTTSLAPTIAVKDPASGSTTTVRLHGNWFITQANGSTAQTLRLAYTDWDGKQQNAWLLGNPTDGYEFLTFSPPADTSTSVDSSTCVANGICGYGASIKYTGADSQKYSASVQGYTPSTGTPTYSKAV